MNSSGALLFTKSDFEPRDNYGNSEASPNQDRTSVPRARRHTPSCLADAVPVHVGVSLADSASVMLPADGRSARRQVLAHSLAWQNFCRVACGGHINAQSWDGEVDEAVSGGVYEAGVQETCPVAAYGVWSHSGAPVDMHLWKTGFGHRPEEIRSFPYVLDKAASMTTRSFLRPAETGRSTAAESKPTELRSASCQGGNRRVGSGRGIPGGFRRVTGEIPT
jgi:hypothetical protein